MNPTTLTVAPGNWERPRTPLSAIPAAPPAREVTASQPVLKPEADLVSVKKPRGPVVKRAVLATLALLLTVGAARLGYDWWTVGRFIESTDDAYVGGDVTVIAPKVAGFISELAVLDNQQVHAGDLLLRLDNRDYQAVLARADAAVAIQQATLANLDATRRLQKAIVAQAQAEIASSDAETSRAHDDQTRYHDLVAKSVVSVQSYQQADTTYKQDLATGEKDRAAEAAAEQQLAVIDTQKQQAQAALAEAVADRDLARLNVSYTELRAPMDGTVGNRSAQIGAYATVGSQLISLIPAHGLWVEANFKEDQLARLQPGAPVTVKVDSIPGKEFHGHVSSIAPATGAQFSVLPPENATGNFTKIVQRVPVRVVLEDEAAALGQLRPGLSVTAKVDTRSTGKAGL